MAKINGTYPWSSLVIYAIKYSVTVHKVMMVTAIILHFYTKTPHLFMKVYFTYKSTCNVLLKSNETDKSMDANESFNYYTEDIEKKKYYPLLIKLSFVFPSLQTM